MAEKSQQEEVAEKEKKELLGQKAEVKQLNDKFNAEQKKVKRKEEELTETKCCKKQLARWVTLDRYKDGRRETKKVYDTYFKKIHDDVEAASRVGW